MEVKLHTLTRQQRRQLERKGIDTETHARLVNEIKGDIVKGHYYKAGVSKRLIGEVVFGYNGWFIKGVKQYRGTTEILTVSYEIIGNTHDNPELLEVE